jgi:hypothetical protein
LQEVDLQNKKEMAELNEKNKIEVNAKEKNL